MDAQPNFTTNEAQPPLAPPDETTTAAEAQAYEMDLLASKAGALTTGGAATRPHPLLKGFITADELDKLDLPAPRYVIPGLLLAGLSMLIAKPKAGKSWFAYQLAITVAQGGTFLGETVPQGDVLYLALEDSLYRLQNRGRKLRGGAPAPNRLTLGLAAPTLDDNLLDVLEAWIKSVPNPTMILIDTMGRILPESGGRGQDAYKQATATLAKLQKLALENNIVILLVHHAGKREPESGDPIDSALGSTGIAGVMDTILVMKRERLETEASFKVTGRDIEEREMTIRIDRATGSWSLIENDPYADLTPERRDVIKAIQQGYTSPAAIATYLDKESGAVSMLLAPLKRDGYITQTSYGNYALVELGSRPDKSETAESTETPAENTDQEPQIIW